MPHFTDFETLLKLPTPEFQAVIEKEYGLTLASIARPKEYDTLDIMIVERCMPRDIKNLVLDLDYAEMTGSATIWKTLWECIELPHFTDLKILLKLRTPKFQEVIEKEYGLTLASVIRPKEYDTIDIILIEHCMPRDIKYLVLARDYADMLGSATTWTPLLEYFEN